MPVAYNRFLEEKDLSDKPSNISADASADASAETSTGISAVDSDVPKQPAHAEARTGPSEWLTSYGDYLFRFALLRVRNKSAAEDLVQDALVSALKAWPQFEGRSSVRTWLTGILLNKVIDYFRASEQRFVASHDPNELSGNSDKHFNVLGIWNSVLSDWASNPQKHLENKAFLGVLAGCVGKLTQVAQRVFVLKVLDGLSTEEVCNILKLTPSHVWVLVHRARITLRDCIELNWINARS